MANILEIEPDGIKDVSGQVIAEGDISGWHIRLTRRWGDVEAWALFNGECRESSDTIKSAAQEWRDKAREVANGR